MPWSGGNYTKGNSATGGWSGDQSAGIGIEAGRHDTQDNDFATGINQCLNKDGSNTATANLNIGNFRITNTGAATARTDAAQVAQVQDGDYIWLGTTAGTATAQTASATPAITAYKAGQKFRAIIGAGLGSTGASPNGHTININGVGAKQIVSNDGLNSSPTAGSWVAGAVIEWIYDGTYMRIANDPGGWQTITVNTSTFTGVAPLTITAVGSVEVARYRKIGKTVQVQLGVSFTTGGSVNQWVQLIAPVAAASSFYPVNAFLGYGIAADAAATQSTLGYFQNATDLRFYRNALAAQNWTIGACILRISFSYEAA